MSCLGAARDRLQRDQSRLDQGDVKCLDGSWISREEFSPVARLIDAAARADESVDPQELEDTARKLLQLNMPVNSIRENRTCEPLKPADLVSIMIQMHAGYKAQGRDMTARELGEAIGFSARYTAQLLALGRALAPEVIAAWKVTPEAPIRAMIAIAKLPHEEQRMHIVNGALTWYI